MLAGNTWYVASFTCDLKLINLTKLTHSQSTHLNIWLSLFYWCKKTPELCLHAPLRVCVEALDPQLQTKLIYRYLTQWWSAQIPPCLPSCWTITLWTYSSTGWTCLYSNPTTLEPHTLLAWLPCWIFYWQDKVNGSEWQSKCISIWESFDPQFLWPCKQEKQFCH